MQLQKPPKKIKTHTFFIKNKVWVLLYRSDFQCSKIDLPILEFVKPAILLLQAKDQIG